MYAREVEGKKLTLGVSGMLWNRSLVMYDQETNSLWSHILGEAMQGPLRGKRLQQLPSVMTDWDTWRKQHPDGSVAMLTRTSREFTRAFYTRPDRFVLGVVLEDKVKAWGLDLLARNPAVNDKVGQTPVLAAFDRASVTARLFDRRLEDRVLNFKVEKDRLVDQETGSTWDPVSGRARSGPLEGKSLKALPGIMSFRDAWLGFHPRSEMGR